jgi:hypothetical protein
VTRFLKSLVDKSNARRTSRRPSPRRRRSLLGLEQLECRNLPSGAQTNWVPLGPAPILGGQTPGLQPVSGRISAIAADPQLFIGTFGKRAGDAGFLAYFDYNADGRIDLGDLVQLLRRLGE